MIVSTKTTMTKTEKIPLVLEGGGSSTPGCIVDQIIKDVIRKNGCVETIILTFSEYEISDINHVLLGIAK